MMKLNTYTWSAAGLLVLLACSSAKPDGFDGDHQSPTGSGSTGSGSTGSSNSVGSPGGGGMTVPVGSSGTGSTTPVSTNGGAAASTGTIATGSTGTGTGTSSTGSGSNGSTASGGASGGDTSSTDGGVGTYDPPPETGGVGQTEDPPPGTTVDPPPGTTVDPPPGTTVDPPPGCTMTEIDKVNVIVFKDATPSGADVEGKMWVGGNGVFDGYGIASKETAIAANCSDWGLVVGGSLQMSGGSINGKIAYGTTATVGGAGTACGLWKAKPVDFAAVETKLKGYSLAFKAYAANGVVAAGNGSLTLTGTNTSLNVFNVTASELNANIKIIAPPNSSVVVNVSGTSVVWSGVGFSLPDGASCRGGTSTWCHRILWNLYEAKTLQLSGIGVQGSVLAPYATVDGGGGNVDGQLVCEYLKGGIEYHPYFFTGCLIFPKI